MSKIGTGKVLKGYKNIYHHDHFLVVMLNVMTNKIRLKKAIKAAISLHEENPAKPKHYYVMQGRKGLQIFNNDEFKAAKRAGIFSKRIGAKELHEHCAFYTNWTRPEILEAQKREMKRANKKKYVEAVWWDNLKYLSYHTAKGLALKEGIYKPLDLLTLGEVVDIYKKYSNKL